MKSDIAISAVTWVRTTQEQEIVLKSINSLSQLDIPIILADKSSPENFLQALKQLSNVTVFTHLDNLMQQLFTTQQEAAKIAEYIFYLQTDKLDFNTTIVSKMIDEYRLKKQKGVFIPARTKESLQTYPLYQQEAEKYLNYFVRDFIGITQDYMAGPKIYPAYLVSYLESLKGEIGWGIESFYYVLAKRLELPFDFYPCFIQAPLDIDDEQTTKNYRLKIVEWQINAFLQAQTISL